jgi:hypothetical protein
MVFEIPELGSLTGLVMEELRKGTLMKRVEARKRQTVIARNRREHTRTRQGGEMKMMVPPESFHYWGQRLGYQCWNDKQFCREYLRDNPECRVESRNVNACVGYVKPMGQIRPSGRIIRAGKYAKI